MSAAHTDHPPLTLRSPKRAEYVIGVLINVAMLVAAHNVLAWGWLPFLTNDFEQVLPWISLSLTIQIAANLVYLFHDTRPVRSVGQIVTNLVSIYATYVMLGIFPFDFSRYGYDWTLIVRILLILAIIGSAVGALIAGIKLAAPGWPPRRLSQEPTRDGGDGPV